jgi:hypothetical protein
LNRYLGENHLIVAGGVWDQPAGEFRAMRHAGWIWYVLDQARRYPGDMDKTFDGETVKYWLDVLEPVRMKIDQEKAVGARGQG